jgi:uncharacterized membrane protein
MSLMDDPDSSAAVPEPAPEMEGARTSAFHTAMAHFYRAEMHRMTVWRQRLDVTTNWAFLLTMALTTFTLGSTQVPHFILLLGLAAIAISILIEARRYRHLHHSQWRLNVMEKGYFRMMLVEAAPPCNKAWRGMLARDLEDRAFLVSLFTAARVRLRRNYLLLVYFITAVWVTKLFVHPVSPHSTAEWYKRFAVGDLIPAWIVVTTASFFILAATMLAFSCPSAEELEHRGTTLCKPGETEHTSVTPSRSRQAD